MERPVDIVRKIIHKTDIGVPRFSPEERKTILTEGRNFVGEVKKIEPNAGVDPAIFHNWLPKADEFARSEAMANIHGEHNIRHVGAVLAEEMLLTPYVEKVYQLPRPLLENAVYASAASHDLLRGRDMWGSVPDRLYKIHGQKMAERIRSGEYPLHTKLSPVEKHIAANAVEFHDVDPRQPQQHSPEDELLTLVDRGELARLVYGIGPAPFLGKFAKLLTGKNPFEKRMQGYKYESYYFPGLLEKIMPLSKAMYLLSVDGIKKGLTQENALMYAMGELGMVKQVSQELPQEVLQENLIAA